MINVCDWCYVMDWHPILAMFLTLTQCSWDCGSTTTLGELLWYKINKTLQDVLLLENIQLQGDHMTQWVWQKVMLPE